MASVRSGWLRVASLSALVAFGASLLQLRFPRKVLHQLRPPHRLPPLRLLVGVVRAAGILAVDCLRADAVILAVTA
eukprot:11615795-Heterocapsa_arctica.AAC.1